MSPIQESSPSFSNAPLIETVLSAQFRRIEKFRPAHFGLFWRWLGDEWVEAEDAQAIEPSFEHFGGDPFVPPLGVIRIVPEPARRMRISSQGGDRVVQIQSDRLVFNWIRQPGVQYPSYARVEAGFLQAYKSLQQFLGAERLGPAEPEQWEVSYVNRIERGEAWTSVAQLSELLPGLLQPPLAGLIPESARGVWTHEIPQRLGRLHIELAHLPQSGAGKDFLRLKFTARGPITEEIGLQKGLNIGHSAIVKTFVAVSGESARKYWGEHDDTSPPSR